MTLEWAILLFFEFQGSFQETLLHGTMVLSQILKLRILLGEGQKMSFQPILIHLESSNHVQMNDWPPEVSA